MLRLRTKTLELLTGEGLLDAIDMSLQLDQTRGRSTSPSRPGEGFVRVRTLQQVLSDGGSAYQVKWLSDAPTYKLERRVDPTTQAAYEVATDDAEKVGRKHASDRLREAWHAAYGRDPDPSVAYLRAVKAVEAAAIPVISPTDMTATLGKINGQLKARPEAWSFVIEHKHKTLIEPVITMMDTLWTGQTDRHEGNEPATPISRETAEAAVHLAVTLVDWFSTGKIAPA